MSGRWVWCPAWWKVVPMMGDKSWLGDVLTVSEWEEAVRNAPDPTSGPEQEVLITEWADLQHQLAEARAALKRVDEMLEDARWESVIEWRETHAAAIKAAREEW